MEPLSLSIVFLLVRRTEGSAVPETRTPSMPVDGDKPCTAVEDSCSDILAVVQDLSVDVPDASKFSGNLTVIGPQKTYVSCDGN